MYTENKYVIDKKSIGMEIFEGLTICRKGAIPFAVFCIFVVISTFAKFCMTAESEMLGYFVLSLIVFLAPIVSAIIKVYKISEEYGNKRITHVVRIDNERVTEEIFDADGLSLGKNQYFTNNVSRCAKGFKYIFLYFSDREVCVLRKDGFENEDARILNEILNNLKKDTEDRRDFVHKDVFKIQKICLIVGIIVSIIMIISYSKIVGFEESAFLNSVKMILAGLLFFLWLSYGITFFIQWWKKQKTIMKVLSIVMYPITTFIFLLLALIWAVPYTVKSFSKY